MEHSFTHEAFCQHLAQQQLMGTRCMDCGALHVPPRPICPRCLSNAVEWHTFSGQGTLIGFTVVHIAPTAMIEAGYGRDNPYCTGIVRLEEGPSISAQIVGIDPKQPETIQIGEHVQVTFETAEEAPARVVCRVSSSTNT